MIEHHVVSLELAKQLKEAGMPQESIFKYCGGHTYYDKNEDGVFEPCNNTDVLGEDEYCHTADMTCEFFISAPLASELGELLPNRIVIVEKGHSGKEYKVPLIFRTNLKECWYESEDDTCPCGCGDVYYKQIPESVQDEKNEVNGRARTILKLVELGIISFTKK